MYLYCYWYTVYMIILVDLFWFSYFFNFYSETNGAHKQQKFRYIPVIDMHGHLQRRVSTLTCLKCMNTHNNYTNYALTLIHIVLRHISKLYLGLQIICLWYHPSPCDNMWILVNSPPPTLRSVTYIFFTYSREWPLIVRYTGQSLPELILLLLSAWIVFWNYHS